MHPAYPGARLASRLALQPTLRSFLSAAAAKRGYRSHVWDTIEHLAMCGRVVNPDEPSVRVTSELSSYPWLRAVYNEDQCTIVAPMPPKHLIDGHAVHGPIAAVLERHRRAMQFKSLEWESRNEAVSPERILTHEALSLRGLRNLDERWHRTWRGMRLDRYAAELEAALARLQAIYPDAGRVWVSGKDLISGARTLVDGAPEVAIARINDRVFVHVSAVEPIA
jgi:hypothetical protein